MQGGRPCCDLCAPSADMRSTIGSTKHRVLPVPVPRIDISHETYCHKASRYYGMKMAEPFRNKTLLLDIQYQIYIHIYIYIYIKQFLKQTYMYMLVSVKACIIGKRERVNLVIQLAAIFLFIYSRGLKKFTFGCIER